MARTERTILVTGATGAQGGAVAAHLLADGWRVRALVRNPISAAAGLLARAGAQLVTGDMADRAVLDAAVRDVHGVFSVQPAWDDPAESAKEITLGINVAGAAHAAGVQHLVYASVGGAERASGISTWATKWQIERHVAALGLPATILRPVQFMDSYTDPRQGLPTGTLITVVASDQRSQLIAVDDIGAFAALAFARPDEFVGRAIEIAGDALTPAQIGAAIGHAVGRVITVQSLSPDMIDQIGARMSINVENYHAGHRFAAGGGWRADIPALRRLHPALMTFAEWLDKHGTAKLTALVT
jgi:uncharacterized protein YbjT (DUF2867 family)